MELLLDGIIHEGRHQQSSSEKKRCFVTFSELNYSNEKIEPNFQITIYQLLSSKSNPLTEFNILKPISAKQKRFSDVDRYFKCFQMHFRLVVVA